MPILFFGGEDSEFLKSAGTLSVDTTAGRFRAGYARCCLSTSQTTTGGWVSEPWAAASSNFYVRATLGYYQGGALDAQARMFGLRLGGDTKLFLGYNTGADAVLSLFKRTNAGTNTLLQTGVGASLLGAPDVNLLAVYVDYQAAGNCKVWLNGTKIIDYSGDVTTDSATQLDGVILGTTRAGGTVGTSANTCFWSEVIVDTEDCRSKDLRTMAVTGTGNTHAPTSGTHTDLSEITLNDATLVVSATATQLMQYTVSNANITGNPVVHALGLSTRAMRGPAGPSQLEPAVRTASTNYFAAGITQPTAFGCKQHLWATNPNTAAAWTVAELAAAGLNVGVRSAT